MSKEKNTASLKKIAKELGFSFCGVSKAEFLESEAKQLEQWLSKGYHGKMQYMENHFDMRTDPRKLVPDAKSVISLAYNYFPENELYQSELKIAKYAYGEDYHTVIKDKLKDFTTILSKAIGAFEGRLFVDSAPVMERQWAAKSGIGWLGKNTLLINKEMGSFFFLANIISNWEFEYDSPIKDYCGTCTACIDACPTDAINQNGFIEANKCISYLTIELKDEIPTEFKGKMDNWIFGCDTCQDVCPWNRFSKPHQETKFLPSDALKNLKKGDWIEITEEIFNNIFKKSALKRSKYQGLARNVKFI